jgi:hypothetical protein
MTWRLLLALAMAALTFLALSGRVELQLARNVVTLHAVLAIAALVLNLVNRHRLLAAIVTVQEAEPTLVEAATDPPPDDVAVLLSEIRALGFQFIALTDTSTAGHFIRTWILAEPSGETWVEVGLAGQPLAIFLSQVAHERLVETAFPSGATVDDPRLRARVVDTTVGDALTAQRATVAELGGSSRRVTSFDDYLAAERDQRRWTGGMRIRDHLRRVVRPAIRDWSISLAVDGVALVALLRVPAQG